MRFNGLPSVDLQQNELCCVGDDVELIVKVRSCKWSPPLDDFHHGNKEKRKEKEKDKFSQLLE